MYPHEHGRNPALPSDILGDLMPSHGAVRNFLETVALPPLGVESQRAAGDAAALAALAQLYELDDEDLASGFQSVWGASGAAGIDFAKLGEPHVPADAGAAAFFDVDNTLIQGASIVLFGMGLAKRGFFNRGDLASMLWKHLKYQVSGSENMDDVAEGREAALELVRGQRVADIMQLAEDIFDDTIGDRIYDGTRELAELHLEAGQEVWLVTATPVQLAQVIARRLGFTGALGTVAEVEDGVFTGRLVGDILHGPGKKHAVAALAASRDLDMAKCTAYSDSSNDVPMLSMVGSAVAINPDRRLRRIAGENGWPVRDYRPIRQATLRAARYGIMGAGVLGTGLAVGGAVAATRHRMKR